MGETSEAAQPDIALLSAENAAPKDRRSKITSFLRHPLKRSPRQHAAQETQNPPLVRDMVGELEEIGRIIHDPALNKSQRSERVNAIWAEADRIEAQAGKRSPTAAADGFSEGRKGKIMKTLSRIYDLNDKYAGAAQAALTGIVLGVAGYVTKQPDLTWTGATFATSGAGLGSYIKFLDIKGNREQTALDQRKKTSEPAIS
jgi:hypothetical protein